MEEVAAQAPDTWFQAYMPGDPARVEALVGRIAKAGFKTLAATVDLPLQVNPERYARNRFSTPLRPSVRLASDGLTHPRTAWSRPWRWPTTPAPCAQHGAPAGGTSRASPAMPQGQG
jgi:L-lactate dehydrogenase (cytochrome)